VLTFVEGADDCSANETRRIHLARRHILGVQAALPNAKFLYSVSPSHFYTLFVIASKSFNNPAFSPCIVCSSILYRGWSVTCICRGKDFFTPKQAANVTMKLLNLPPTARLQIWSKCVRTETLSYALRPQIYTASLPGTKGRLPAILSRRYTVTTSDKDLRHETTQPPLKENPQELQLGWDSLVSAVREALDRDPKATQEEKDALLEILQWCVENKSRSPQASKNRRFIGCIQEAIPAGDPLVEIRNIVESVIPDILESKRGEEQYAHVPQLLFMPNGLQELFGAWNLRQQVEIKAERKECTTVVDLHLRIPEMHSERTFGTGPNKKIAKQKAWLAMLVRLDATGVLPKLASHAERVELVDVVKDTEIQEEHGLIDVYNYAAKFGLTPHVEMRTLKRQLHGNASQKAYGIAQVSIKLPEHNLEVVTHSLTCQKAEVSAVLAFKRAAEELQMQHDQVAKVDNDFRALGTETAVNFVNMVMKLEGRSNMEFKSESIACIGMNYSVGQWTSDGEPIGQRAIGRKRDAAEKLAYLTAAIELARKRPEVLSQYATGLARGNSGKSQTPTNCPVVVTALKAEALDIMEKTLLEAAQAGLSHQQETLKAMPEFVAKPRGRPRPQGTMAALSQRLLDDLQRFEVNPDTAEIRSARAGLPMSHYSSKVLDLVSGNVYSVIVGATGSGKTTQVPQIILNDAIRRSEGGDCNIICTQPRRLAATSVARRVAAERGEKLGQSVGYHVRGDSKFPELGGSITYCTTGILLERLKWNADDVMDNATHLVLDEVHERDMFIDFLLIVLKKAITARQLVGKTVPKVVLMSATMDSKLFSAYLPNEVDGNSTPCPSLDVPGRAFPVKEMYLEEILNEITETYPEEFRSFVARDKDDSSEYMKAEKAFARADDEVSSVEGSIDWKMQENHNGPSAAGKEEALVPIALPVATIAHICKTSTDGAILAFLPGVREITAMEELMKQERVFGINFSNEEAFRIHSLHSAVPLEQQREIFEPLPTGCRRIILSTNIAETSVTVPDVKHVVDLGKLRQRTYTPMERISALPTTWESDSNARQRAGRAGRVSDGNYYALYTRKRREAMSASGIPELLRTDLQETCLSIKAQGFQESVSSFLSAAIEPPLPEAVRFAVDNLKAIEAFTKDEEVTALGGVLAKLPVHPALGKMILLGLIFRCLDPMIIIASMHGERPLFVNPVGHKTLARAARQHFNEADSDHIACLQGFQYLREYSRSANIKWYSVLRRAKARYIHFGAFSAISHTANQIRETLIGAGLLDADVARNVDTLEIGGEALNRNSKNIDLIKSLILAGVYPNMGAKKYAKKSRAFRGASEETVIMHPTSVNYINSREQQPAHDEIFAFTTLARSADANTLFMRDSTLIPPLAAMLFGGRLDAKEADQELVMDGWLPFKFDGEAAEAGQTMRTIMEFRNAKDRMLNGVFRLLSNPGEAATAVNVMEIFTDGLVKALDADAKGRNKESVLNGKVRMANGDISQETAWSDISQLYRSRALGRMEKL
jgi:ATP-dependent RNA helicase DHX36